MKANKIALMVVVLGIIGCLSFYLYKDSQTINRFKEQTNSATLQQQCSNETAQFLERNNYNIKDQGLSYENHYNSKLGMCFILVNQYVVNSDFSDINLYNALENKHYASFTGYDICDPSTLVLTNQSSTKCQLNSGSIWLDGNDQKAKADEIFGFNGIKNGGVGNQNTQTEFIAAVQPFLNN
jgi:hypothetical protein